MSQTKRFPLPVSGIDVLSNETALVEGAVRLAINVDIGRAGRFKRRVGYTPRITAGGLHSLYYAPQKGWTLVAKDRVLKRMDLSTYVLSDLFQMNSADPLEYTEYNGNLYFSNRSTIGWVPSTGTSALPVGVQTPSAPTVAPNVDGGLAPGKYGVAVTFVNSRGEESGACEVQVVDLPTGGSVKMTNPPQAANHLINVYITTADGDVLRRAGTASPLLPIFMIAGEAEGSVISTQFLVPMPPGDIVRWHNGRLYTARDGALRFSEPMRPHLHDPAHGVIPFSGHIAFVESVSDGLYVGDSRGVWFLPGNDPTEFKMVHVSPCRAVAKSSIKMPPEHFDPKVVNTPNPVAVWLSTSGYVVGMSGGTAVELEPDRIKVPPGLTGRSAFLLRAGRKQIVTPVNSNSTLAQGAASDSDIN